PRSSKTRGFQAGSNCLRSSRTTVLPDSTCANRLHLVTDLDVRIFTPLEAKPETRVALTPEFVEKLGSLGADVSVESRAGLAAEHDDEAYAAAGATIVTDRAAALGEADIVLRVRKPPPEEIALLKRGALHVSFLDP